MTNNPLIALFKLFLDEYKKEPRKPKEVTQFYFEMSQQTFDLLLYLGELDGNVLEKLRIFIQSGEGSMVKNKTTLGCLHWDTFYVPLVLAEDIPKGKAVLRKHVTKF